MDYTYFDKECYHHIDELDNLEKYDLFISMFVDSDRVKVPYSRIKAKNELWITISEDQNAKFLKDKNLLILHGNEDFDTLLFELRKLKIEKLKICVDSTGFRLQYLLFLMRCMEIEKVRTFDILYTEPKQYRDQERTNFSDNFYQVKKLYGMSGVNTSEADHDLLIIAAGYDHSRIIDVAKLKKHCKKVLLFGFPSLSPDMFQENVLRAYKAESDLGSECFEDISSNIFAPAYDPFVTAQTIKEYIEQEQWKSGKDFTNIYFAPLSSKPHAIGMAIYFLLEKGWQKNYSIIYPFCNTYYPNNSDGVAKIWRYTIELPTL